MSSFGQKLIDFFESKRSEGLFTHGFFEAGNLDFSEPLISYGDAGVSFDLSSLTKPLATSLLLFKFLRQHGFDEEASLGEVFGQTFVASLNPEFPDLTFESLLGHTSGLPFWRNFYVRSEEGGSFYWSVPKEHLVEVLRRITINPEKVGVDVYSDLGPLILGHLLEEKTQKSLTELFEDFLLEIDGPVGKIGYITSLVDPFFVSSGFCALRQKETIGEVQDENAASLGGVVGHTGLFSKAGSFGTFLKKVFQTALGKEFYEKNTALIHPNNVSLLGMRQASGPSMNSFGGGMGLGHLGFTGTAFVICPKTRSYSYLFTNRLYSGRDPKPILGLRQFIFKELYDACSRYRW